MNAKNLFKCVCAGLVVTFIAGSAWAQTDPLYMSDGDARKIIVVQSGTIVNSFPASPQERAFPIAIVETVRTTGYWPGESGGEYELDGTPTGAVYKLMEPEGGMSDGTTDGEFNYAITFNGGHVWVYDEEWANGQLLFSAGGRWGGIAYDATDDTFWVSADRAAGMRHYDRNGNLLGEFPTEPNLDWNLALEPSSGTLWVSTYRTNRLHNYAKDGTHLGTIEVPGMNASSFFSGEFQFGGGGCGEKAKLKAKCPKNGAKVKGKLRKATPNIQVTFKLDGGQPVQGVTNNKGKAKAKWTKQVPGGHTVTVCDLEEKC